MPGTLLIIPRTVEGWASDEETVDGLLRTRVDIHLESKCPVAAATLGIPDVLDIRHATYTTILTKYALRME